LRPIDPIRGARDSRHEVKKEWGASVLEYTILVSLVVLVVVGAMTALGGQINRTLPDAAVATPTTTVTLVTTTTCPPTSTSTAPTTSTTSTTTPTGC
jgi:Flp pilus assembly pilin Flp